MRENAMLKRLIGLCCVLLACMGVSQLAAAQTVDEIIKKGELVVGIDLTNPPWGFLDAKQEPAGFDPAFAKLVADKLGVKLRIERVTGSLDGLRSPRVRTKDRRHLYLNSHNAILQHERGEWDLG